jgi:general secretion pathway protein E/type IV pilus assembly protein PilB
MTLEKIINIPLNTLQSITAEQAWYYHIIPLKAENGELKFYIDEGKMNEDPKPELEILFGKSVNLKLAGTDIMKQALSKLYPRKHDAKEISIRQKTDDFLFELIYEAHSIGSSDIHIESYEDECRVRFRIDGKLIERYAIAKEEYPAFINKIKIKSNLDIAEKRLPQDGRIFFRDENSNIDIRVSVLPSMFGEKVVMRLLNKESTDIDIHKLGFAEEQLEVYLEGTKKSHGIILISGPTGSGKTTTLYATLKVLNRADVNILTIEDPIEYTLKGINQVQLKEAIGLSFASALRTFLRQDPDIIMLGEIRDGETAQMATRAALTGHLVLSTIHTNSAIGTITRLADMNVPGYLVANTLNLSVAQRLVRVLCPACKSEQTFDPAFLPKNYTVKNIPEKHSVAIGCENCLYTGYKGRKAVYEVIPITGEIANNIRSGTLTAQLVRQETNIVFLHEAAYDLFCRGETSIEEIYPILLTGLDN